MQEFEQADQSQQSSNTTEVPNANESTEAESVVNEEEKGNATGPSKVFSRDLYAQRGFWNDRFAESNGHFDWYANWK